MSKSVEKRPPASKLRNWCLFCTGGLLTSGGLGWCLRLAYAEHPKVAFVSYAAGAAGVYLMNNAVFKRPGTKDSGIPIPNCLMMFTGGILVSSGFGYCLTCGLREDPKSTMMAYTVASLGYIMIHSAFYTMCGTKVKKQKRRVRLSNKKIYEMVTAANARLHYVGTTDQCEFCKRHVEKVIRERKAAEERSKMNVKVRATGFLQNLWQTCLNWGRGKRHDSLAAEKSSRGGLKREISKTCQDTNIEKEQSDSRETKKCLGKNEGKISSRKQLSENDGNEVSSGSVEKVTIRAPDLKTSIKSIKDPFRRLNSKGDTANVYYSYDSTYRMPKTVPNTFPDEKSTQTESRRTIMATQTEESFLTSLKETAKEDPTTIDSQPDVEEGALVEEQQVLSTSDLTDESHRQDLLEVPTENQQLELEDKQ